MYLFLLDMFALCLYGSNMVKKQATKAEFFRVQVRLVKSRTLQVDFPIFLYCVHPTWLKRPTRDSFPGRNSRYARDAQHVLPGVPTAPDRRCVSLSLVLDALFLIGLASLPGKCDP